jgi:SAM-dependent methyltransferase
MSPTATGFLHEKLIFGRRSQVLSGWFSKLAPQGSRILDVGCGNGLISALLLSKRPDLSITGIDVLVRPHTHIPVAHFDGVDFPCKDNSYDLALFCDVLHHTNDPMVLLREASRVARYILIKDHFKNGLAANARLRLMDWVGNARFGVVLPYNYWEREQWSAAWMELGLQTETIAEQLGLYPQPLNFIFGSGLHFIALLRRSC